MQALAYSWLAAAAAAPLVAVLSIWTAYVFHTYRRRWRTVDLFFLATVCQELVASFFSFGFAVINLISPRMEAPCGFILWGLTSARTFQIATLTSLVVDRALTVRWPYRYRFSVRRNQIRYHIAVLAVISLFVGVAAVFARLGTDALILNNVAVDGCSTHPLGWDLKFSIFVMCLYGVLTLTSFVCWADVEVHRCRNDNLCLPATASGSVSGGLANGQGCLSSSSLGSNTGQGLTGTASSGSVSSSGSGSTRLLYGVAACTGARQTSQRPYASSDKNVTNFRWTSVAAIAVVCYAINHMPFMVLTIVGTVVPTVWSPWYENVLLWLRLVEGLMVPLLLYVTDQPHKNGFKRIWTKAESKADMEVDDGRFRTFSGEFAMPFEQKPGPFGSLTPVGIITNYRRTRRDSGNTRKSARNWIKAWSAYSPHNSTSYGVDAVLSSTALPMNVTQRNCHPFRKAFHPHHPHHHHHPFVTNLDTMLSGGGGCSDQKIQKSMIGGIGGVGGIGSVSKMPSVETDLPDYSGEPWKGSLMDDDDENHIYASLSDNASDFSFRSTLPDESTLNLGEEEEEEEEDDDEEVYGGSFTTVANDDFEFHDTRPCGGEVRMRPSSLELVLTHSPASKPATPKTAYPTPRVVHVVNNHNSSGGNSSNNNNNGVNREPRPESRGLPRTSIQEEFLQMIQKHEDLSIVEEKDEELLEEDEEGDEEKASSESSGSVRDLVIRIDRSGSHASSHLSKTDSGISPGSNPDLSLRVYRMDAEELRRTNMAATSIHDQRSRLTSFSMNDLDRIGGAPSNRLQKEKSEKSDSSSSGEGSCLDLEEVEEDSLDDTYVFPVKSDSMISLCKDTRRQPKSTEKRLNKMSSKTSSNQEANLNRIHSGTKPTESNAAKDSNGGSHAGAWESWGKSSSSSSLLGDHCVRKAKEHIKSKKYKVSNHERRPSRKRKKTVSLNSIHRVGSDVKQRSSIPDFRQFPAPTSVAGVAGIVGGASVWSSPGLDLGLSSPISSNFRLQRPSGYTDVFKYYNPHRAVATGNDGRKRIISGFI